MKTYSKRNFKKFCKTIFKITAITGKVFDLRHIFKKQRIDTTKELVEESLAGIMSYEIDQEILNYVKERN